MAGRRSPWGKPRPDGPLDGEGQSGAPDQSGAPERSGASAEPGAPADPPAAEEKEPRGPRNPWLPGGEGQPRRSASIEDIFRGRDPRRGGGGPGGAGGGFPRIPQRPDGKSWFPIIAAGIAILWLGVSTVHQVGPKEEGVVTTFGKYSRTIEPGVSITMPWPIQSLAIVDVTSIKVDTIPDGESDILMLTSDQNLVDLSYLVRWNIKDLKLYSFRLADPNASVRQVAEAAMRASIAEVTLNQALSGAGRGTVEQNVKDRMQRVLDNYQAGVRVQGVEIKKADPPQDTLAAFRQVTAAQQDSERDRSNARAWAEQLLARAQGDSAAFDKVYAEYKLAPEVTRRRMYYETMERVLNKNSKVIMEGSGVAPFLPLPEMKKRAGPVAEPTAPKVKP